MQKSHESIQTAQTEPESRTVLQALPSFIGTAVLEASDDACAYSLAVLQGIISGVRDIIEFVQHPIDNGLYPLSLLLYDAAVIAAHHIETDDELVREFHHYVSQQNNAYPSAVERMQARLEEVKNAASRFSAGSALQKTTMISHAATSVFLPGFLFRGTIAVKQAVSNKQRLGTFSHPPKFCSPPDALPAVKWTPITLEDIRKTVSGKYLYVITEDSKLVIAPRCLLTPVDDLSIFRQVGLSGTGMQFEARLVHPMLSEMKPVYAAGEVDVTLGKITSINNASGHFLPHGQHLSSLVERAFVGAGYAEARGTYLDFSLFANTRVTRSVDQAIVIQERFKLTPGGESFLAALNQAAKATHPDLIAEIRASHRRSLAFFSPAPISRAQVRNSHTVLAVVSERAHHAMEEARQLEEARMQVQSEIETRLQAQERSQQQTRVERIAQQDREREQVTQQESAIFMPVASHVRTEAGTSSDRADDSSVRRDNLDHPKICVDHIFIPSFDSSIDLSLGVPTCSNREGMEFAARMGLSMSSSDRSESHDDRGCSIM